MTYNYLHLILSLFFLCQVNAGPCGDISLAGCKYINASLIDVIKIPDSENSEFQCQTVCAYITNCNHFRYDHSRTECSLLENSFYQAFCDLYSGPGSPTIENCFSGEAYENSCDAFRYDGCSFSGEVVFDEDNVKDVIACENLQVTLGPVYGANAFVFDSQKNDNCKLYRNVNRYECTTLSGPKSPDFTNCEADTTTLKPTTFEPLPPGPNIYYESCSEVKQPLEILNAWVSPFPVVAPAEGGGSFDISVTVILEQELPVNSRLNLTLYLYLENDEGETAWFPIECFDDIADMRFGSCMYDVQDLLDAWAHVLCPQFFPSGQDCQLPLKPGVYAGKHTVHLFENPQDCYIDLGWLGGDYCVKMAAGIWKAEARTILEDGTEFTCVRWLYEIQNSE